MERDFASYEAYLERYKMFWSEEGDGRPPLHDEQEFKRLFRLLEESYRAYRDLVQMGNMDQAANYYAQVINPLENELAIADAADNFHLRLPDGLRGR
jgi:hypothetical protein